MQYPISDLKTRKRSVGEKLPPEEVAEDAAACEARHVNPVQLEVCVQSPADCLAAARGGADRVELCQAIELGGLTPSLSSIQAACELSPLPVIVLLRPRPGDFVYSDQEIELVRRDLEQLSRSGARGAALGALTKEGAIDAEALETWKAASGELELVFHRAFDSCAEPDRALSQLVDCGIQRVLTSGGAETASQGAESLARWRESHRDQLEILPAGSIRPENVAALVTATGADQVHFRAPMPASAGAARPALGTLDTGSHEVTDAEIVRAVRDALSQ